MSSPDEDELVVLLGEAEAEQGPGDGLPVDVVQEDVPLVEGPEEEVSEGAQLGAGGSPEGRVHVLPEAGDEAHLGHALLAAGQAVHVRPDLVSLWWRQN